MLIINGTLDVRIEGNNVHIRVSDYVGVGVVRSTAELSRDNVRSLRATLDEALIRLGYPEQNAGLGNDTLEQP
jgi:hypothetical protein